MADKLKFDISAKDKTKRAFSSVTKGLKKVGGALLNFKTALVGVAGVAGIGLLIKSNLEAIDKLGKLSRQLFISTEDLGAFRLAAELGGTSLEAFAKGSRTLAVGINDFLVKNTGIAKEAFEQLDITAEDLRATNGSLYDQFLIVADGLNALEDGADKTAIAYKLFGGRNIELLTAIEGGSEGLRIAREEAERFGLTLSSTTIAGVESLNDNITRLKFRFIGFTQSITGQLAPAFDDLVIQFGEFIDKQIESKGGIEELSKTIAVSLLNGLVLVAEAMGVMITRLKEIGQAAFAVGEFFGIFEDKLKDQRDLLEAVNSKVRQQQRVYDDMANSLVGANEQVAEEKELLDKLIASRDILQAQLDEEILKEQALAEALSTTNEKGAETLEFLKNYIALLKEAKPVIDENTTANNDMGTSLENVTKGAGNFSKGQEEAMKKARKETEQRREMEEMKQDAIQHTWEKSGEALSKMATQNEKAFKAYKAYAIADAIIKTYQAAVTAFKTYGGWPFGAIAAAATVAAGMAQVSVIRSQTYSGRRFGGNVRGGTPYTVGEGGPETFVPDTDGTILPNQTAGTNVTFNITTVDAKGFGQLLDTRRGQIISMINSAMNTQGKANLV